MPSPLNLLPNAVGQAQDAIRTGTVSHLQPVPVSFASPLYVVIDGWDQDYYQIIPTWPQCHGSTLPVAGATVVLVTTTTGALFCVFWAN